MTTRDELFLYVMHRFSEVFEQHAVLKGGMALRLLDSPRATTDIDYVFTSHGSKKSLVTPILGALEDAPEDVAIEHALHSKMLRVDLASPDASIQIEVSVADACPSVPMSTATLAQSVGRPPQVVRVMEPGVALAHKIAAWNERRLARDLYDAYFLFARAGVTPHLSTLDLRLSSVQSRLPRLKKKKRMTREELVAALVEEVDALDEAGLKGLAVDPAELAGLALRMQTQLRRLIETLRDER